MRLGTHLLALAGVVIAKLGTLTPSDLAHFAAAFSGTCAGVYYAAQAAAFIRDKFIRRRRR